MIVASGCSRSDAGTPAEQSPQPSERAEVVDENEHAAREFPLLVAAAHTAATEYFDPSRIDPRAQLVSATTGLGLHLPEFFSSVDGVKDTLHVRVRAASADFPLGDLGTLDDAARRLAEILVFTQGILDLDSEPRHELEYAAINGLFAPLDPHTILLTPEEHSDLGVRTRGEFGGIGAQIRAEARRIAIVRVLPGMPAELAGVAAGDVVLKIGTEATVNMTSIEAQQRLRGAIGSEVVLRVRRGKQTLNLSVTRARIHIDSVERAMLPAGVGYLRLTAFQEDTAEQVRAALVELAGGPAPLEGLVLDVRGNAGGLLTQATAVVDQFVTRGELVIVRSALGREVDPATTDLSLERDAPIVVMVDEESASASEIVSGGLKALGRAVVVGRTSFGKGTVQMLRPSAPYGRELALKLTVAEYLVAGDGKIQGFGVVPDLELFPVELTGIRGVVRYYDLERFERERERFRTAGLPSAAPAAAAPVGDRPVASIRYLVRDASPTELASDQPIAEALRDPEVRIAQQLAATLKGRHDRASRMAAVQTAAAGLGAREDARIVEALGKVSIAWTAGAAPSAASLTLTGRVGEAGPVRAGEAFSLRLELTNHGTQTLHRVHVMTDCVHDELDGIELLVGEVAPGHTEVRTLKLRVMPWHRDFADRIGLVAHVGEPGAQPDAEAEVAFDIRGASRSSLSYDYWIVDDPSLAEHAPARPPPDGFAPVVPWSVSGNGDGMLQPGETVLLAFVARNDGPGDSDDVRAVLRNLSGRQGLIEEGAVTVGGLAKGESFRGAFGITVGEHADPAVPFELELAVGDPALRTSAQDRIRLTVLATSPALVDSDSVWTVADEAVRLYAGADPHARIAAEAPVGVRLRSLGRLGAYHVLEHEAAARRYFVPADLDALVAGEDGTTEFGRLQMRTAVLPPRLNVDPPPTTTTAATVKLSGVASHPHGVRDVVVLVRPPGAAQIERKVDYLAAPSQAMTLPFAADVPLEPGGNRIIVVARDGAKVEHREDVWVYRGVAPGGR